MFESGALASENYKFTKNEDIKSSWNLGPDTLYPAHSTTSSKIDEAVQLRIDDKLAKHTPISVFSRFKATVEQIPKNNALAYQVNENWNGITYEEYWNLCIKAAKSFIKLKLKLNNSVALIGFNSPQWMIGIYGAIFAGGVSCGIYSTNSTEACEYVLKDSNSHIVLVENQIQLEKILKCKDSCKIDAIIQYTGDVKNTYNGLVKGWNEFLAIGESVTNNQLEDRIRTIAPNKCATLIYTSGTTGDPKAAMISHDNINYSASYVIETAHIKKFEERIVSYLPLSHIAAQLIDCFICSFVGATVYFAKPDAFKGTLAKTISDVQPTLFFGVPRVWEKMQERIEQKMSELSKPKVALFRWAIKKGQLYMESQFKNENQYKTQFKIADKLVLSKARNALGLDKARMVYSGAAPISKKTLELFMGLGLPICEVFGMSETTGPHVIGLPNKNRVTSVGHINSPFNTTKIINADEDGNGELCMYGRHIFMGYLNNPAKTRETIDENGYLYSGDVAKIDKDGFLYITGRIKELIITAGGENVFPVPIEDAIKQELSSFISNALAIGDQRKFLTVLLTLKSQINLDTMEPLDELTDECINNLKAIGSKSRKVSEIINNVNDPIYKAINEGIERANSKALSNVAKVKKFTILPNDFSITTGELGNTFKVRRQIVAKKYANLIEKMYNDGNME